MSMCAERPGDVQQMRRVIRSFDAEPQHGIVARVRRRAVRLWERSAPAIAGSC